MNDLSRNEGKTILYVSHNMGTIRRLCTRVIVLEKGHLIFNGDVEAGIERYMGSTRMMEKVNVYDNPRRHSGDGKTWIKSTRFLGKAGEPIFYSGEKVRIGIVFTAKKPFSRLAFRWVIYSSSDVSVGMATTEANICADTGDNSRSVEMNIDSLAPGKYIVYLTAYSVNEYGYSEDHDTVVDAFVFEKTLTESENNHMDWRHNEWGYMMFPSIDTIDTIL
jgi:lipopolysaccharide transport system ATP-binding protein